MLKRILIFFIANCSLLITNCFSQPVTQQWVQRYSGLQPSHGANGLSVKLDSMGFVYVLVSVVTDSTSEDYGLLKYSNSGNLIWSTYYNTPGNLSDHAVAFAVTGTGDIYIAGTSAMGSIGHITTVKFNTNGILQWAKVYNGGGPIDGA